MSESAPLAQQDDRLDEARLRRLIELGRELASNLDLESLLRQVLDVAREVTGARYAALGVLDPSRRELERFLTVGIDEETERVIGPRPRGRGVLGELIRHARPLRVDDVGDHPRSFGFPPGHPVMRSFLGVPVLVRGDAWGNLYLTEKEGGGPFTEADEEAAVVLAGFAATAIQNARLYEGVESERAELHRAVTGLEATTEIARAIGGETDLDRVLELIAKRGRALIEARWVVILLSEDDELVVKTCAGEIERDPDELRIPVETSLAGRVLRSGRPLRLDEVGSPLLTATAGRDAVGASAALLVPLRFRGDSFGVLLAADRVREGPRFSAEDEHIMGSFAASAAIAVHTARSVANETLRRSLAAAELERTRWARELHDDTLQGMAALQLALGAALSGGDAALRDSVHGAVDQLQREIAALRTLITELRPAALDQLGLEAAIESLVSRVGAAEGLDVAHEVELRDRLAPELESTVYRLVQEALTNVIKHAGAHSVSVRVREQDATVEVAVEDDGVGFDPRAVLTGFGLIGMRERAALVGGELQVRSEPGAGATVTALLPRSG